MYLISIWVLVSICWLVLSMTMCFSIVLARWGKCVGRGVWSTSCMKDTPNHRYNSTKSCNSSNEKTPTQQITLSLQKSKNLNPKRHKTKRRINIRWNNIIFVIKFKWSYFKIIIFILISLKYAHIWQKLS